MERMPGLSPPKPRVFVFEPTNLSLKNAHEFGEVAYVCGRDDERPSIWSPDFVRSALQRLDDMGYDPVRDFFVAVGHQVPLLMVVAGIAARAGVIKTLVWVATENRYVARVIGEA